MSGRACMLSPQTTVLAIAFLLCVVVPSVSAFGAGNIPSYAALETKAFRHGDIEDVLAELARKAGGGFLGIGAKKFGGLDIKRVYFGNWLRDYSQAMDVAGLAKLSRQAIINVVAVLGFLAHGYATGEFEVTEERLGVYLPVEHIDNPKGYNDNKDARLVHPALRGPIQQIELEIDPRSGMKNYIANENGHWPTSAGCVRATMLKCIEFGRRARASRNDADLYEAYRLMGTFLHTLEDLFAHSNWCELSLILMGHRQVFSHVGDQVLIQTPHGLAPPLVTGTFGGSDFIHSLLGETTDHISQASVDELQKSVDVAKQKSSTGQGENLRSLLMSVPGGDFQGVSRQMDDLSRDTAGGKNPMDMTPEELHANLWKLFKFRDDIVKSIETTIEKIPGLGSLIEKITDSINVFIFTTLEPYLAPILTSATKVLHTGSAEVINNENQFEVFDNPMASDPTHSRLSKDHFSQILNEPAGKLAKILVKHTVNSVIAAWDDNSIDPHRVVQETLTAFHHPFFADRNNKIHMELQGLMSTWLNEQDQHYVLNALTKNAVRANMNVRKGMKAEPHSHAPQASSFQPSFLPTPQALSGMVQGGINSAAHHIPGYSTFSKVQNMASGFGSRDLYENQVGSEQQYHNAQDSGLTYGEQLARQAEQQQYSQPSYEQNQYNNQNQDYNQQYRQSDGQYGNSYNGQNDQRNGQNDGYNNSYNQGGYNYR